MKTSNPESLVTMQCVFWDKEGDDGFGEWSVQGCMISDDTGDTGDIVCECSHLSTFSVLAVSDMETPPPYDDVIDNDVIMMSCP